jgi:hypothetical protein
MGARARTNRVRRAVGTGIFDDIFSGIKNIGSTLAPLAVPIATNLIARRMGMGLRRKRRPVGGSITAPGMRP